MEDNVEQKQMRQNSAPFLFTNRAQSDVTQVELQNRKNRAKSAANKKVPSLVNLDISHHIDNNDRVLDSKCYHSKLEQTEKENQQRKGRQMNELKRKKFLETNHKSEQNASNVSETAFHFLPKPTISSQRMRLQNHSIMPYRQVDQARRHLLTIDMHPELINKGKPSKFDQVHTIQPQRQQFFVSKDIVHIQKRQKKSHRLFQPNICKYVTHFCRTSTINALHYMVSKSFRKSWIVLFTIVTLYCFYNCTLNVQTYLRYDMSTKILDQQISNFRFPAITFCPVRVYKRSKFGNLAFFDITLAAYYSETNDEVNNLILENRRSCDNGNNFSNEFKSQEYSEFVQKLQNGSVWITNEYFVNFRDILIECFWNKQRMNCSNGFLNHITDVGACFTFNPDYDLAKFTSLSKTGYGIDLKRYDENRFATAHLNEGLKLFINIKQSEYCGTEKMKRGAGLFFQIHEAESNPSFLLNPSSYISPGYDVKVVMKPTTYIRKTKHLGRCTNKVPLYLTPNIEDYVIEHCYMQCATEYILKSCKCYPPNLGSFHSILLSKAKELGLRPNDIKVCLGQDFICLNTWLHDVMRRTAINKMCPYCKKPCKQTKYSAEITSLLLSQRNLHIPMFRNMTLNDLRKNNVIVHFALKPAVVQLIIEGQSFDLEKLFLYIGNNILLFLGMSFTSIFELVYFINHLFVSIWRRY